MRPSEFFAMDKRERAFIIAAIDVKAEDERKSAEKRGVSRWQ